MANRSVQIGGKTYEGTEEQIMDFLNSLPDVGDRTDRKPSLTGPLTPITPVSIALKGPSELGRLGLSKLGIPEEDILPMTGQAVGSAIGGFPGATAGAAIGQTLRQVGKVARGGEFKPEQVGFDTAATAIIEGATRIPARAFFAKSIALKEFQKGFGNNFKNAVIKLSELSKSNTNLKIQSIRVINFIDDAIKGVSNPTGSQARVLRQWKNILSKKKLVGADDLLQFEKELGEFTSFKSRADIPGKLNPNMNAAMKRIGSKISSINDGIAKRASDLVDDKATKNILLNFKKSSLRVSNLFKQINKKSPGLMETLARSGGIGTAAGFMSGNPLIGALTAGSMFTLSKQPIRQALFKARVDRVASLAASEMARRFSGLEGRE